MYKRQNLTVRIFTDRKCFGPGVAELLRRVRELHSLRAAAMSMGMAYSKAWTVVRNAEDGLGFHLLTSTAGGKHGGGAELTDEAVCSDYQLMQEKCQRMEELRVQMDETMEQMILLEEELG